MGSDEPDEGGAFAMLGANLGIFLIILGWLAVPAYFFWIWNKVGRDPPAPPIIPLFHPPEQLSPAALSFAHFNGFRTGKKGVDLPFIAALLSLGVKRFLVIDEDSHGQVTLRRGPMAEASNAPALPPGEAALFSGLLLNREEIILDKHNGPVLKSAVTKLRMAISREYAGRYYNANIGWFIPGVLLAIASFIIGLILQDPPEEGILYLIPVLMTSLFGGGVSVRNPGSGNVLNPLTGDNLSLGAEYNANRDTKGDSKAAQGNSLSGSVTVTVAEVLPNGILAVRGEKWMTLNTGDELVRIAGLVRADDISTDNTVSSTRIADARITYSGTGAFADASQPGWLDRFFLSPLFPF